MVAAWAAVRHDGERVMGALPDGARDNYMAEMAAQLAVAAAQDSPSQGDDETESAEEEEAARVAAVREEHVAHAAATAADEAVRRLLALAPVRRATRQRWRLHHAGLRRR